MKIQVNGQWRELPNGQNLLGLLQSLPLRTLDQGLAVAINDDILHKSDWETRLLQENDMVEIIQATQGG